MVKVRVVPTPSTATGSALRPRRLPQKSVPVSSPPSKSQKAAKTPKDGRVVKKKSKTKKSNKTKGQQERDEKLKRMKILMAEAVKAHEGATVRLRRTVEIVNHRLNQEEDDWRVGYESKILFLGALGLTPATDRSGQHSS